jgi:dUTP pyrophosphatase
VSDDLKKLAEREMADGLTWARGKCRRCGHLAARRDVPGATYDPTNECSQCKPEKHPPVQVKRLTPTALLPTYATDGSAGADLYADETVVLLPNHFALISTGISVQIPRGYEGQVRPRSGLAAKHGVTVLNAPGTIDSDYRGPVGVVLINHGWEPFTVERGSRIAQLVIAPVARAAFIEADELDNTKRGEGGFGSTGK